ncbi:MAG: anthranilate phosphoribosyltransferase [Candidatus Obscuribacterales bacterium]|nr:anthranilate phosphoribosyltransferase [Steroidobacteraceae bacterium]
MISLRDTLNRLLERGDLSESAAGELLVALTDTTMEPALAGAFLAALRAKGVTANELRGFAKAMRSLAKKPILPEGSPLIDMVGTGGDSSGTFNLSTGASLLVAATGARVAKHGSTSITSRSGAADVLKELGLPVPLDEVAAGKCLAATNFTFFFAPHYHPAMKALGPIRKALGVRTVFNILGPLTNPAEPPYHLIGAFNLEAAELIAETLSGMKIERAFVVHGAPGWDEPTPVGSFECFDVRPGKVARRTRDASEYDFPSCKAEDLKGGDAVYNAEHLRNVLEGRDRGPHRHALIMGAALALEVSENASSPKAAAEIAAHAIDSGAARATLQKIAAFATQSVAGINV